MIIDTHAHVGEACLLAPTVAAVERGYPVLNVEALNRTMDEFGVSKAVLIQWGSSFDHHYLAQCLRSFPGRFAAVCEVDTRREDAGRTLRCLVERHGFRGVRITTTDRSPGKDPLAIWKMAADVGAIISASARSSEDFAAGLKDVLATLPDLPIRIEHLARPPFDQPAKDPTFDRVLRLADYPNVCINLDGFLQHDYPDHRSLTCFPFEAYQEFVRRAVSEFGSDRCQWGSEFPFLNNPYDIGLRFLRETCDFLNDADRARILGENAAAFWRF